MGTENGAKRLGGKELADYMNGLLQKAIFPNADEIARLWADGKVAAVCYALDPELFESAVNLGWDGKQSVFELTFRARRILARADHVTEAWVNRSGPGRVYLMVHRGSLLLNLGENGWGFEPGSTDAGLFQ